MSFTHRLDTVIETPRLILKIPSLAEFTMLGKTWYHATETLPDGSPKYQRIIIDAPAGQSA